MNGKRATLGLVLACCFLASAAGRGAEESGGRKRHVDVYMMAGDVQIDGRLDESAWHELPEYTGFRWNSAPDLYAGVQTSLRIGYDGQAVYLGIRAHEPRIAEHLKAAKEKDTGEVSWNRQLMEILISPETNRGPQPFHFCLDILGHKAVYKALLDSKRYEQDVTKWQPADLRWDAAVYTGSDFYTMEARIPYQSLGSKPQPGERWRFHVGRHGTWSIPNDIGARDLGYYLGEITGRPVPVIQAEDKTKYPGLLLVIESPQPVDRFADDLLRTERQAVHVYREGREIRFAGHTWAAVFYSVVEFLDRQGVRWLYPSVYGDYVKPGKGLDLAVLPLQYTPRMELRWFGGHSNFPGNKYWTPYHRWNAFFARQTAYSGMGHHSFASLIPGELYKTHPEFFPVLADPKWEAHLKTQGYNLGERVPYEVWPGSMGKPFCTSSPEAREYIVARTVERAKRDPAFHVLVVGEMDATWNWCECPRCMKQDIPGHPNHPAFTGSSKSERLADLAAYLGRRLKEELGDRPLQVAVMAYNQTIFPPQTVAKFPANVTVNVVVGAGSAPGYRVYLSPGSPHNQPAADILKQWAAKTSHLGIYTHDLLTSGRQGVPYVMVTGTGEWFRFWSKLGASSVPPEVGTYPEQRWLYNPWSYYVYSRLAWNPDEPAETLRNDFFTGYFREASEPMLAYYTTLENHVRANDLTYGQSDLFLQANPQIFTAEVVDKAQEHLRKAEEAAKNDFVIRKRVASIREGFDNAVQAVGLKGLDRVCVAAISAASPEIILNAETAGERFLKPGRFNGKTGWTIWGTLRAGDWISVKESGKYQVSVTTFFHADGMHGRDTINGKPAETAKIALVAGCERKEFDIPRAWKTSSLTVSLPAGISPVYVTGVWGTYFVHELRIKKAEFTYGQARHRINEAGTLLENHSSPRHFNNYSAARAAASRFCLRRSERNGAPITEI